MRINLRDTKPMKRDLVYTTGELPTRPFDATRFLTPSPHQNRCRRPRVEKVGLPQSSSAGPDPLGAAGGIAATRLQTEVYRRYAMSIISPVILWGTDLLL